MSGASSRHGGRREAPLGRRRRLRARLVQGRLRARHRRRRAARPDGRSGQATLEYLVVACAFLAMLAALGLVWHAARDGLLVERAVEHASHGAGQGPLGLLADVVGY